MAAIGDLTILDAADQSGRGQWLELWQAWPEREVAAHPAYVQLFATGNERTLAALARCGQGAVLLPFLLRPLATEDWTAAPEDRADITTAYGYGGAFYWGLQEEEAQPFWAAFTEWAQAQRVVSAFARLSLFPEQILRFPGDIEIALQNVVRFLDLDADAMWRDYAHKVRKNVKRARSHGLTVGVDLEGTELDAFLSIYYLTMERREADEGYYFPREFFRRLVDDLRGSFAFFHARKDGLVVSTELVLVSANKLYSFLGGTRADAFHMRPNDLLKHHIIEWGREHGKRAFVLGGGYGGEDGIFQFKKSFAPKGQVPFCVGRWVLDANGYNDLVEQRRTWEAGHGRQWSPKPGFFPAYRG